MVSKCGINVAKAVLILLMVPALLLSGVAPCFTAYRARASEGAASEGSSSFVYQVKKGDNVDLIAKRLGVDKNDVLEKNKISSDTILQPGQKLIISTGSDGGEQQPARRSYAPPSAITMDVAEADIRDVLSSLAIGMGVSIIYLDEPVNVTMHAEDMSPGLMLELVLKKHGLEYIRDGDTLVIGKASMLEKSFFSQMVITRFSLKYITADALSAQLGKLGLELKEMKLDGNPKAIWIQAAPQTLGKVREVITALDRPENANKDDVSLTVFELSHISAKELAQLITDMELKVTTIRAEANQKKIWAQGSAEEISKLGRLIEMLDVPENRVFVDSIVEIKLKYITPEKLEPIVQKVGIPVNIISLEANTGAFWAQGAEAAIADLKNLVQQLDIVDNYNMTEYDSLTRINLKYMSASALAPIIQQLGIEVKLITVQSNPGMIWVMGKAGELDAVNSVVAGVDIDTNRRDLSIFAMDFSFVTADQALAGLAQVGLEGVKTLALNQEVSKSLLIICPRAMESTVKSTLWGIDTEMGKILNRTPKLKIPVDYGSSSSVLNLRANLLSSLTGVPRASFKTSGNVSRDSDSSYYVLWLEETQGNIKKVKDMINLIDKPVEAPSGWIEGGSEGSSEGEAEDE
ncbi:LysM domain-containing protein [Anaerobacterium chartisolvens]|uniref:LysM domain-containing protein n=2 Tax=Anaerobacterium chartisolvens TaxID=1297424 RepID=A0A369AXB7_9FIRM|nr:LysM domain-containing protein [Anaerobacterium chartisolvens]